MPVATDENSAVGQRTQEKHQFYAIALAFTVLGLSIQTAAFGRNVAADVLELLRWASLLASGLVGLWRLECVPNLYNFFTLKAEYYTRAKGVTRMIAQGYRVVTSGEGGLERPINEVLGNAVDSVAMLDKEIRPWEAILRSRYRWQRGLFVAGFVTLALARALIPVLGVVGVFRRAGA